MPELRISVVIPCYNEEANLKRGVLEQVAAYLEKQRYGYEVIIADDCSTDQSLSICESFAAQHAHFRVIRLAHGGKPSAIFGGIQEAVGEIILFSDMDQSTPIYELDKLIVWFDKGYDVVIGSRGLQRAGFSPIRQVMSWGFRNLRRLVLLPRIVDTQCGFKAMRAPVARKVFPRLSFFTSQRSVKGWVVSAFDVELLFLAQKAGFKIKEVEVEWQNEDQSTTKEKGWGKFFKETLEMVREIVSVIANNLSGRYKDL